MGITRIMDWAREHYNKQYAPKTREPIRSESVHPFVEAGIALHNPDEPGLPNVAGQVGINAPRLACGGFPISCGNIFRI
jgi:BsuBI/PstI restriction endonuclease HTH domain